MRSLVPRELNKSRNTEREEIYIFLRSYYDKDEKICDILRDVLELSRKNPACECLEILRSVITRHCNLKIQNVLKELPN